MLMTCYALAAMLFLVWVSTSISPRKVHFWNFESSYFSPNVLYCQKFIVVKQHIICSMMPDSNLSKFLINFQKTVLAVPNQNPKEQAQQNNCCLVGFLLFNEALFSVTLYFCLKQKFPKYLVNLFHMHSCLQQTRKLNRW